jgi:hypothetical protein
MVEMLHFFGHSFARRDPKLVGMQPQHVAADLAKAVNVSFAGRTPVYKVNSKLEGCLALADHF